VIATSREIVRRLAESRVIAVTSFDHEDEVTPVVEALRRGGISCIEVTFRTTAAAAAIARAAAIDGMLVGAGTVLSVDQLQRAASAGAHFAVSPGTTVEVVLAAREAGLPFFPGVATPTEIDRARDLHFDVVKVFPADALGGPAFLRSVAAVYPELGFIPTGGINNANLDAYLASPGVVAVGGSWITSRALVRSGNYAEIERLARAATESRP
jgi:2-dehydro-3-deoxyphosphogluconate aldolase/(4S)-4-hydroxy-2-oxoglutarate aldolase